MTGTPQDRALGLADGLAADSPRHTGHTYQQSITRGKTFIDNDEQYKARDAFMAAALAEPAQLEPQLWLCRLAYRARDWRDLHARTGAYLKSRPDDREIHLLHARACTGVADWNAAASAWAGAGEDRPGWPEAPYQQARALVRMGRGREARALAGGLAVRQSDPAEALTYAVRLYLELGDFAQARDCFAALIVAHRDVAQREQSQLESEDHHRGLAVALCAQRDVDGDSRDIADRALTIADALFRRAISHERTGDLLQAFFDYEILAVLSTDDGLAVRSCDRLARGLVAKARKLLNGDALEEAAAAVAEATRATPSDIGLRRTWGRTLMRDQKWELAVAAWAEFAGDFPNDTEGALQFARALDRSGRLVEATSAWRTVRQRGVNHEEAHDALSTIVQRMTYAGRTAINEKRFVDAYDLFAAVLREAPDNDEAMRRLDQVGRNLLKAMRADYKARDLRRVLSNAGATVALLPEDAEVQLLIGRAAVGLRRHEVAVTAWRRLADLDPAEALLANLQEARCHLHLGARRAGEAALERVRRLDPANAEAEDIAQRLRGLA